MSAVEVRRLVAEECENAMRLFATAMQFPALSAEQWQAAIDRSYPERSFGAFEGGEIVGHARSFPFRTLVPGGARVATAGVTAVATAATHRRRGILSAVMAAQLRHTRAIGEPLASLRASEGPIYGRFGYGVAGLAADVTITPRAATPRHRLPDAGSFRYVRGPETLDLVAGLHPRCLRRPGEVERPMSLLRRQLGPLLDPAHGEPRWLVVHLDRRGKPDGFAEWEAVDRAHWHEQPHVIEVGEVAGTTEEVEALLWQFVLDLDLIDSIKAPGRPLDDPLRWRLTDPRSYSVTSVWDEQWLRVVDVPAALAARTYNAVDDTVVVEVSDPLLPDNDGRYELSATGVRRVRRSPDLLVPIDALGAVYLGGTSVTSLARAGRLAEHRPGGVARADALLHSVVAPWCGTFF